MATRKPRPVYGPTNPSPAKARKAPVQRLGSVIRLTPAKEQYYRKLHAAVWPGVLARLRQSHFRNYSIYVATLAGKRYLFSYLEYTGQDLQADTAAIAADPATQRWWQETDPCQIPLPDRKPGANWTDLEMVFLMVK